MVMKDTSKHT